MPNINKPRKKSKKTPRTPSAQAVKPIKKSNLPTKQSPIDYYNCLLTAAQQDWFDPVLGKKQKITACCKKCKLNAPSFNKQRTAAVKKLIISYQQVGDSLAKLLQPLK